MAFSNHVQPRKSKKYVDPVVFEATVYSSHSIRGTEKGVGHDACIFSTRNRPSLRKLPWSETQPRFQHVVLTEVIGDFDAAWEHARSHTG